jgi:L-asparaginase
VKILFVQTGGTIDKDYPKVWQAYSFEITEPAFDRILELVNPAFGYRSVSALKKDSMDMTDEDRRKITELCKSAPEQHIVITHGTDTMSQTAEALSGIKDKTIVITGSARPERFSNSDAGFNVGTAVGAVQTLSHGVYISMNGLVSEWNKVEKSSKTGQFKTKEA